MTVKDAVRWFLFAGHEPDKRKLAAMLILALAVGLVPVITLSGRLYLNIGISTSKKLFWASPGPIKKGDYVSFMLDHPLLKHPYKVVKQVRCVPGDHLYVDDKAAYCNGKFLGLKKKKTLKGEDMPKYRYDGVIPPGKYFVMNEHKDSFDSRYYGLVDEKKLLRMKVLF